MDYDREVTPPDGDDQRALESVEKSKAWFLQMALEEYRSAQDQYNLNREFAKTRQNRNFVVALTIAATIAVFGLAAFFLNNYFETTNNTVRISSQEFEDINLRELLDSARKLESDLAYHESLLAKLAADQETAQRKARSDLADQLALLRSTNPGEAELQAKSDALSRRLAATLAAIEADYAARRRPIGEALDGIRSQLAAMDARKLEVARKQEVILNNERKVYDVERQRVQTLLEEQNRQLAADYEARLAKRDRFIEQLEASARATLLREQARLTLLYNPVLEDEASARLLAGAIDPARQKRYELLVPDTYRDIVAPARAAAVNRELGEYRSLLAILRRTPYLNSVPPALDQLQYRTLALIDATAAIFDDFWKTVKDRETVIRAREATIAERDATITAREATIAEREATIAERDAAIAARLAEIGGLEAELGARDAAIAEAGGRHDALLASFARVSQASRTEGVVVDPSDPSALIAWIDPAIGAAAGQRFYVLHGANEVQGEYELGEPGQPGSLSRLVPSTAPAPRPAAGAKPAPAAPKFSAKPVLTMDWLIRVENYAAWKASLAKNPVR